MGAIEARRNPAPLSMRFGGWTVPGELTRHRDQGLVQRGQVDAVLVNIQSDLQQVCDDLTCHLCGALVQRGTRAWQARVARENGGLREERQASPGA